MTLLGVLLLILGLIFGIQILWIIGLVLIVLGVFFLARPVNGQRWY
jgi:hypothetical protein